MALSNILSPRFPIISANGSPIRGGEVFLYEPGTTTFITSYKDSGLITEHTNPIRLSGSGRANIWISRNCDLRIEDRVGNLVSFEENVNPDSLGSAQAGGLLTNGSFEIDTDANNIPDGWVLVNNPGSTNALDTTQSTDGSQSFRFTSVGTGGGSLTSENFFPVNGVDPLNVNFDLRSTIATVRNSVTVGWFDASQTFISRSTIYDSTANPTVFTSQNLQATPPANARFAKIILVGCAPSVAIAGSTYFDRVSAFYPAVVSGVFDNITIQDNNIISTNTNGNININPNGNGHIIFKTNLLIADPDLEGVGIGGISIARARMSSVTDVALASTGHALQIGATNALNLALARGQIQARNNGAIGELNLNTLGGDIRIGQSAGASIFIDADTAVNVNGTVLVSSSVSQLVNPANTDTQFLARNTLGGIQLSVNVGGGARIAQMSAIGAFEDTWIEFVREADVSLHHNAIKMARTATAANGAFEVNNTVTGVGFERVLTASDLETTLIKTATTVRSNTAVLADDPDLAGFSLVSGRKYSFEAYFQVRSTSATPDFKYQFTSNASNPGQYVVNGVDQAATQTGGFGTTYVVEIQSIAANQTTGINIKGFKIPSNADETLTLQWAQNTANAASVQLQAGSWIRVTDLGTV